jgi:methionine synthase II (cobalamin-independent)
LCIRRVDGFVKSPSTTAPTRQKTPGTFLKSSHPTDLVEHPELVADRIITFAEIVGQENVIAGTDCGLGGRVHPQIAWAKLRVLRDGAAIASKKLWS